MPDYKTRPEAGTLGERWFQPGEYEAKNRDVEIYQEDQRARLAQARDPLYGASLGEVSRLTGESPEAMATNRPGAEPQYTEHRITDKSGVPSYHYMPTMSNGPEAQGPPDIRQAPDQGGQPQPIEQQYPQRGQDQPMEPQLRRMSAPLGGPRMTAEGPSYQTPPLGTLEPQDRPTVSSTQRVVNPDAPATPLQQAQGRSAIHRQSLRQSGMGGGGATQFKYSHIANQYGPDAADEWLATGVLPGSTKEDLLRSRTHLNETQAEDTSGRAASRDQQLAERERHNRRQEEGLAETRQFNRELHADRKDALARHDDLAVQRLDFAFEAHQDIMDRYDAMNKAGMLDADTEGALRQGLRTTDLLKLREPSPKELSFLESLGVTAPAPRHDVIKKLPPSQRSQGHKPTGTRAVPTEADFEAIYQKLPSGSLFTGPDGVPRVKP